jgi:hypothetical protein
MLTKRTGRQRWKVRSTDPKQNHLHCISADIPYSKPKCAWIDADHTNGFKAAMLYIPGPVSPAQKSTVVMHTTTVAILLSAHIPPTRVAQVYFEGGRLRVRPEKRSRL